MDMIERLVPDGLWEIFLDVAPDYLQTGRERHAAHVAPTRAAADLIIDGTTSEADMLAAVMPLIKPTLTPPPTTPPPTRGVRTLTHTPHTPAFAL
jgi:uridine kinase